MLHLYVSRTFFYCNIVSTETSPLKRKWSFFIFSINLTINLIFGIKKRERQQHKDAQRPDHTVNFANYRPLLKCMKCIYFQMQVW